MKEMSMYSNELIQEYFNIYHIGEQTSPDTFAGAIIKKYLAEDNIYHNGINHIWPMLNKVEAMNINTPQDMELQFVAFFFAIFHDVVTSVGDSRGIMNEYVNMNPAKYNRLFQMVHEAISATTYNFDNIDNLSPHAKLCVQMDVEALNTKSIIEIQKNEELIFNEYTRFEFTQFTQNRLAILENIYEMCNLDKAAMAIRFEIIKMRKPKIAVYAGTFNPFHIGHMNIVNQAKEHFDKVIIAMGVNHQKDKNFISDNDLQAQLPRTQIEGYPGLLSDYLNSKEYDVTLIRGLRNGEDLQYEQNMRSTLTDLDPSIKVVYYICDRSFEHISSSMVRELKQHNTQAAEKYTAL